MSTLVLSPRLRRGGRRVGLVYAGVSVLLVLALLPALHPPRPPLPPVAAFAPEAQQNPTKPPPNQASIAGKGKNQNGNGEANGGSGATPTPSPTPTPPPNAAQNPNPGQRTVVPRLLDCVGGPGGPRQIEDTQSPPCIPYWKGDNGGATYQGVDANTIRIGIPGMPQQAEEADWINFFNDRFQLYGRKVVAVKVKCGAQTSNPLSDEIAQADAAATQNLFAVLGCSDHGGQERYYYDELARKGVVTVAQRPDLRTEADYTAMAPYEWNYLPGYDTDERNLAAQACAMRNTPVPAHAASVGTTTRVYGILYSSFQNSGTTIELKDLTDGLAACGIQVNSHDIAPIDYVAGSDDPSGQNRNQKTAQQAQAAALQMFQDHVTTVFAISHSGGTIQLVQAAESLGWHPEWLMGTFMYNTDWGPGPLNPTDEWNNALGLSYYNKLVPAQDNPWYWAVSEEDPSYTWPYAPLSYNGGTYEYPMILLLFSGLQMAGPHLTPQTFQQGLWNTHFPNPPSPYYEGTVGFNQDHTFVKDRPLVWYSSSNNGPWGQQGVWCYVNHGTRYTDSDLPSGNPYFQGACDS